MDTVNNVDKNEYFATKYFAQVWNCTVKTVIKYCKNGLIENYYIENRHYYLHKDTIRPLNRNEIKKIIVLILIEKNNPRKNNKDYYFKKSDIAKLLKYLAFLGYICEMNNYNVAFNKVTVSQKGIDLVFSGFQKKHDVKEIIYEAISIINNTLGIINNLLSLTKYMH